MHIIMGIIIPHIMHTKRLVHIIHGKILVGSEKERRDCFDRYFDDKMNKIQSD